MLPNFFLFLYYFFSYLVLIQINRERKRERGRVIVDEVVENYLKTHNSQQFDEEDKNPNPKPSCLMNPLYLMMTFNALAIPEQFQIQKQ